MQIGTDACLQAVRDTEAMDHRYRQGENLTEFVGELIAREESDGGSTDD